MDRLPYLRFVGSQCMLFWSQKGILTLENVFTVHVSFNSIKGYSLKIMKTTLPQSSLFETKTPSSKGYLPYTPTATNCLKLLYLEFISATIIRSIGFIRFYSYCKYLVSRHIFMCLVHQVRHCHVDSEGTTFRMSPDSIK